MNQAELYLNHNIPQRTDSEYFLNKYIHLLKWNSKGEDVVMDIGCATGDFTTKVLLPMMPTTLKKLVGVDVSENMIEFAKSNFEASKVEYFLVDISSKQLRLDWYGSFDHLFSLYCFHWVLHQRQTIKNMYDLLKPEGDVLLLFLAYAPIFEVYEAFEKSSKWGKYLLETQKYLEAYKKWRNIENVRNLMNEVGFLTRICKYVDRDHIYENIGVLKQSMRAVNPFVNAIPKDLQDDYMHDIINEMKPLISVEDCNLPEQARVILPCRVIIVVASKLS